MVKIAALFPGQGSQAVGMAAELAARWPSARGRFDEAAALLGYDLLARCTAGPEEALTETSVAQPALYVAGYATWEVLAASGVRPAFVAGHSLGEYTACAAAGVFSFADGLKAVKARGEAMRDSGTTSAGMAAVIGASPEDVDRWVAGAAELGVIVVANRNAPDQVIVSGEFAALDRVEGLGKAAGVKVVRLKVSGAFHSPLMAAAAATMKSVLSGLAFNDPACPVVGNVAGLPLRDARMVREELEAQITSAVRWDACVRTLAGHGVTLAVECGPGRVLAGLVRKIDRSVKVLGTGGAADVEEALALLNQVTHAAA